MYEQYALVLLSIIAVLVIIPTALMLLWNWLFPVIFGLPEITYLQAVGLWVFSNILFDKNMRPKRKK